MVARDVVKVVADFRGKGVGDGGSGDIVLLSRKSAPSRAWCW